MSSSWIYIDASGRVDDRSWNGDNAGLAEATNQIVIKLHRISDTITATHDRYESEPIRSVITFTVSRSSGPDYYAGKLLLVPSWVANALIWPRVAASGSDATTPCPFCPSRTLAQCKTLGCTHLAGSGEPIPERGSAEWRNLFQCEWNEGACAQRTSAHAASVPRACERCGLVAGCACERGA